VTTTRSLTTHRRRSWAVRVATTAVALLAALLAAVVLAPAAPAATPPLHVVRPGETLTSVAARHGLPVATLAGWNGLATTARGHPDGLLRLTRPAAPLPEFRTATTTVTAAQLGASWRVGCPVAPSALRSVRLTYLRFDGTAATGELILHESVVSQTKQAFKRLYAQRFPIQRMEAVSVHGGSDDRSMAANNTSAFNCRRTTSGTSWSEHAYGRAIDVNPVQNPYVSGRTVLPAGGTCCTDRTLFRRGMLHAGGGAVNAFTAHGFVWGGAWQSLKDYQHLSTTGR
jgi:hypothetical protein